MAQASSITNGTSEVVGKFMPMATVTATTLGTTSVTIPVTQMKTITGAIVQILDSGNNVVTSDADITWSGNVITIADGSSFSLANTYVAYILAWGTPIF